MKDKSSISKKNHITKLQYANAIFIERNAILEREWKEALRKAKEWQDEYNHVRSQVFHVFGEKLGSSFMRRGLEIPEGLIQEIRRLLEKFNEFMKESTR